MQSLFDSSTYNEVVDRLNNLSTESRAQWGKMNVSQMLAHCKEAFKVPLSEKKYPRIFMGVLMAWMFKSKLYNDTPYSHGLPTSPDFIIKDERDFHDEKQALLDLVNKFYSAGPNGISKFPHPFFGNFTAEQWGMSMYKHLDHHLRQFAA